MSTPDKKKPLRWAIPFGRYVGKPGGEAGENRTLVGREGQRIAFSDFLLNHGPSGAFLVTGQRGAGKTTFVKECLRQYADDVLGRTLRSNVGRSVYWDRVVFLSIAIFAILALAMAHELLATLVAEAKHGALPYSWFLILPLVAVCGAPIIYGLRLYSVVLASWRERLGADIPILEGIMAFGLTLVASAVIFFLTYPIPQDTIIAVCACISLALKTLSAILLPTVAISLTLIIAIPQSFQFKDLKPWLKGSAVLMLTSAACHGILEVVSNGLTQVPTSSPPTPAVIMSRVLVGVLLLTVGVQQVSVRKLPIHRQPSAGPIFGTDTLRSWYKYVIILTAALSLPVLPDIALAYIEPGTGQPSYSHIVFWSNVCIALALVAHFLLLNYNQAISRWYLIGAFITFLALSAVAWIMLSTLGSMWWMFPLGLVSLSLAPYWLHAGFLGIQNHSALDVRQRFVPRPQFAILAKATAACALGVHLSMPVLLIVFEQLPIKCLPVAAHHHLDGYWLLAVLLTAIALARIEYQWIIGPFAWLRDDRARDRSRSVDGDDDLGNPDGFLGERMLRWIIARFPKSPQIATDTATYLREQNAHARYVRHTFHWLYYKSWQQVIVIHVNLGFDKLEHMQVVHAMLTGLRDSYHKRFLSPLSEVAVVSTMIKALCVAVVATFVSESAFLPKEPVQRVADETQDSLDESLLAGRIPEDLPPSSVFHLVAPYPQVVRALHHPIVGGTANSSTAVSQQMMCVVLPCQPISTSTPTAPREQVTIRGYDLAVFILIFGLTSIIIRRLEITPYAPLARRIDDTLHRLSGRVGVVSHGSQLTLRGVFTGSHQTYSREADPVEPRTIENEFMQILNDIQHPRLALLPSRHIHLPAPEITFIFDELDKIGTQAVGIDSKIDGPVWIGLDVDRVRSQKVNQLFAEMKNLLSAAPARFVMVGGRNLHDEWLADQTARVPLLTNIFRGSIYLPSLLVDVPTDKSGWHGRVDEYVRVEHARATHNFSSLSTDRQRPAFGLTERNWLPPAFVQSPLPLQNIEIADCEAGRLLQVWQQDLYDDFIFFLTFRSMGNPKKLKELLESFVRPTGRYVVDAKRRWKPPFDKTDHILLFGEDELFRVQLVASVYRQLQAAFEVRYRQRDDKLVIALFYFSDFLFKFHERAFTWTNLERVDELVHVHRAPDHRALLEAIVVEWSERVLHPILNGLYAYRFRSDVAREIAYISRRSKEEMAAFNFTLDESQALKEMYQGYLHNMKPNETFDVIYGLGEIYEFDQEFEVARHFYQRALEVGDRVVENFGEDGLTGFSAVVACGPKALAFVRTHMVWGVSRLRIMLQIGLTFEIARNLERAAAEYRDAKSLARVLLRAYLDESGRAADLLWVDPNKRVAGSRRVHSLKHLNILYQATFAEAWAAEKMTEAIDSSISLVERELYGLRGMLPFVRQAAPESQAALAEVGPVKTAHANFSLSMAELHAKAGDLYFFKGRQHRTPGSTSSSAQGGAEGYLLGAHFHYAMCLHDLRRFIRYRRASSAKRLNFWRDAEERGRVLTIQPEGWPDFVFRAVGGGLGDLAETGLARVSFFGLISRLSVSPFVTVKLNCSNVCALCRPREVPDLVAMLRALIIEWLESDGSSVLSDDFVIFFRALVGATPGSLGLWMGRPSPHACVWSTDRVWESNGDWLKFDEDDSDQGRIGMALLLGYVGADMLAKGGYMEDAARDLMQIADSVHHLLSWATGVARIGVDFKAVRPADATWQFVAKQSELTSDVGCTFWCFLVDLSLSALERAHELLAKTDTGGLGDRIPVDMLYTTCALGLVADKRRWMDPVRRERLRKLVVGMGAEGLLGKRIDASEFDNDSERIMLRDIIKHGIVRYQYPALTRLRGIKLLLDNALLFHPPSGSNRVTDDVTMWAEELNVLNEQMQAPLHFTPLHMGTTLAHLALSCKHPNSSMDARRPAQQALTHLHASLEMTTMRRSYYESISNLYYLYDDYNDSQIHFNHAIQMAGYEYALLLEEMLREIVKPA